MKLLKRFSLFEILLILSILGVHLYAAFADGYNFPNIWFIRDDAYYYFKVAQNITEGFGSTFDRINITNGYHPLWLLICIPIFALARFDLILPLRILLMLIAVMQAATAVLIYRIMLRALSQAVAIFAALFWAFNGYIHYAFYRPGLETPLAAFALALFIYKLGEFEAQWRQRPITRREIGWLAVFAALAMFSRLDLVFLAFIAGIFIVFRGQPLRFLLPFDAVISFLAITASVVMRVGFVEYPLYASSAVFAAAVSMFVRIPLFYFMGLYRHPRTQTPRELTRRALIASAYAAALFSALMLLFALIGVVDGFPRAALLYDWLISSALLLLSRFAARWFGSPKDNPNLSIPSPLEELRLSLRNWLGDAWAYYRILGGALFAYMLSNRIFFGASMPVSGQVKRWWGSLLHTVYDNPAKDWREFLGIGFLSPYDAWQPVSHALRGLAVMIKPLYPGSNTEDERYYIVMAVLLVAVLLVLFFNPRHVLRIFSNLALMPLLAGGALHTLSYTATSYGGAKEWYWISQSFIAVFILGVVIDLLLKPVQKFKPARPLLQLTALALGVYFSYGLVFFIVQNMRRGVAAPDQPYMDVVAYLEEHTRPGAIIGMTGGGNVGYFIQDRTIVNMDGLINSYEYFHALQAKRAPEYLYQRGMRVVFSNIRLLSFPPYEGQFTPYLLTFSMNGNKNLMRLYPEPLPNK